MQKIIEYLEQQKDELKKFLIHQNQFREPLFERDDISWHEYQILESRAKMADEVLNLINEVENG